MTKLRICEHCKAVIARTGMASVDYAKRRYCSQTCYREHQRLHSQADRTRRTCEVCGYRTYLMDDCERCRYRAKWRKEHQTVCDYVDREYPDAPNWIDIARSLVDAQAEGRLDPGIATSLRMPTGAHTCLVCGMRTWAARDAKECCSVVSG